MSKTKDAYMLRDDFDIPDSAAEWDRSIGTDQEEHGPTEVPSWATDVADEFPDNGADLPF